MVPVGLGQSRTATVFPVLTMVAGYSRWASVVLVPTRRAEDGGFWGSSQQGLPDRLALSETVAETLVFAVIYAAISIVLGMIGGMVSRSLSASLRRDRVAGS